MSSLTVFSIWRREVSLSATQLLLPISNIALIKKRVCFNGRTGVPLVMLVSPQNTEICLKKTPHIFPLHSVRLYKTHLYHSTLSKSQHSDWINSKTSCWEVQTGQTWNPFQNLCKCRISVQGCSLITTLQTYMPFHREGGVWCKLMHSSNYHSMWFEFFQNTGMKLLRKCPTMVSVRR